MYADLRPSGPNLSRAPRAVNLQISRSEINKSTQGTIREHSEGNQSAIREQSEHLNQSHTVGG